MKDICKKAIFELLRLHYLKFQIPPAYGLSAEINFTQDFQEHGIRYGSFFIDNSTYGPLIRDVLKGFFAYDRKKVRSTV